jgi:hypothetical protein
LPVYAGGAEDYLCEVIMTETAIAALLSNSDEDCIVDAPELVAAELGVALRTLQLWRVKGVGPPFVRVTSKTVGYPRAARKAWLRERIVDPRAEAREARKEPSGTNQHT